MAIHKNQKEMKLIRVVIVDDHYLMRQGIRSVLAEDPIIDLVGEGRVGEHVLQLAKTYEPDVLLLDIGMPQYEESDSREPDNSFHALPTITYLRRQHPKTKIIIVSQYASPSLIEVALELGIKGYILKGDTLSENLPMAIKSVYNGGAYLSEGIQAHYFNSGGDGLNDQTILTKRQLELMRIVALNPNWSYAEHGAALGISEHTVSNHLQNVFTKLRVNNLAAAIVKCVQLGIIKIGPLHE